MIDEIGDNGIVLEDGRELSWIELRTILTELKEFVANCRGKVQSTEIEVLALSKILN